MRQVVATCVFSIFLCTSISAQAKKIPVNKLIITWEIVENYHDNSNKFLSAFTITNSASRPLSASGWSLYFNFSRTVYPESVTGNVVLEHINGDLFRLYPNPSFQGIYAGQSLRIAFVSSDWAVPLSDAPSGLYWVWDEKPDLGIGIDNYKVIPSIEPVLLRRSLDYRVALTPQMLFEKNAMAHDMAETDLVKVFPTPLAYKENHGLFMITESTRIVTDPEFDKVADYLVEEIYWLIGKRLVKSGPETIRNCIMLKKANASKEAYQLSVGAVRIEIAASDPSGIFYGIQSLKTLIPPMTLKTVRRYVAIPAVEVVDAPRFPHRALFLDVAKNFQSRQQVKKIIDVMALYKLNVLHLHLADDEGWRLEIRGLPELIQVGSRRGHTQMNGAHLPPSFGSGPHVLNAHGSGHFSCDDFIDILRYATARFVTVIPGIETPGHARAAIMSMEERYRRFMNVGAEKEAREYLLRHPEDKSIYKSAQGWNDNVMDPGMESTYKFFEHVIDEIIAMYTEAKASVDWVHVGGDEVPVGAWAGSPACLTAIESNPDMKSTTDLSNYFFNRIHRMLASKGISLYGRWETAKTDTNGMAQSILTTDLVGRDGFVDVYTDIGGGDMSSRLADAGYKVVLSNAGDLNFNIACCISFDETGNYREAHIDVDKPFSFVANGDISELREGIHNLIDSSAVHGEERTSDHAKSNIIGIQGLLWAENIRGSEQIEYYLLPKLLGLAERAWSVDPRWASEADSARRKVLYREAWSAFANVMGKRELPRLDYYHGGYNYYIPSPGAIFRNGLVEANIQLPGFVIRYTTDGKEPTLKSKEYEGPVKAAHTVKFKAFSREGRSSKTTTVPVGTE